MVYFSYLINLITNIMTSIVIPIPFATDKIYYFSIFSIIMGFIVLSIIIYFITKLLGIETNIFWGYVSDGLKWDNNKYKGTDTYTISKQSQVDDYTVKHTRRYSKKL